MADEPFALSNSATPQRRRGRPAGAKNRRSVDLARYVAATYGGQTPGQQSAAVAMVTPGELKRAKAMAKALGVVNLDLSPVMLAMVVKARQLATALGCDPRDAWLLMAKERIDLMAYVHQRQPQAEAPKVRDQLPMAFLVPEGGDLASLPSIPMALDDDNEAIEIIEEDEAAAGEVT